MSIEQIIQREMQNAPLGNNNTVLGPGGRIIPLPQDINARLAIVAALQTGNLGMLRQLIPNYDSLPLMPPPPEDMTRLPMSSDQTHRPWFGQGAQYDASGKQVSPDYANMNPEQLRAEAAKWGAADPTRGSVPYGANWNATGWENGLPTFGASPLPGGTPWGTNGVAGQPIRPQDTSGFITDPGQMSDPGLVSQLFSSLMGPTGLNGFGAIPGQASSGMDLAGLMKLVMDRAQNPLSGVVNNVTNIAKNTPGAGQTPVQNAVNNVTDIAQNTPGSGQTPLQNAVTGVTNTALNTSGSGNPFPVIPGFGMPMDLGVGGGGGAGSFDLPAWGGPYSAPLTGGQLDALSGFDWLAQSNPIAMAMNQMQGGGMKEFQNALGGGGDQIGMLNGFAGGTGTPDYSQGNQWMNALGGFAGGAGIPDFQGGQFMNALGGFAGGVGMPDFSAGGGFLNQLGQMAQGGGLPFTDVQHPMASLGEVGRLSQTRSNYDPAQQGYQNLFGANFNLDPMFAAQNQAFGSENARQQAQLGEQLSGLGLSSPASTDRIDVLNRAQNEGQNQLNLQQLGIKQQAFENQQNRNLSALPGFADLLGRGTQEAFQGAGLQLGALPYLLQAAQLPFQENLAARGQQLQASGMGLEGAQNMVQQQLAGRGENIGAAGTGLEGMLNILQQQMAGRGQNIGAAEAGLQGAQNTIQQQLAGRGQNIGAAGTALQGSQNQMAQALQALGLQGNLFGQQYGMGEQARGVADQDIVRRMQEYARTQGGGLQQMIQFMGAQPGLQTAVGPSGASQLGELLGSLAPLLGLL